MAPSNFYKHLIIPPSEFSIIKAALLNKKKPNFTGEEMRYAKIYNDCSIIDFQREVFTFLT